MREPLRKTEGQYTMMAASKAERPKTHKKMSREQLEPEQQT